MPIKKIICICTSVILIFTTGCWNYIEVNERSIVTGVAIDYDRERDLLIQTVEIATPKLEVGETLIDSEIVSGRGGNFFDAARGLISRTGRRLFWGHTKILIVSEEIAKDGETLISVLDYLKRDGEPRDTLWILLSGEETAREIFEKTSLDIEKIISFYLEDMLKSQGSVSKYYGVPLWKFTNNLSSKGISPTLPVVKLAYYRDKVTSEISGTGVFDGTKLVGFLDGMETRAYMYVIDEIKGGIIVVEEKGEEKARISLEILGSKTKIVPQFIDGDIVMKIIINTDVNIAEIGGQGDYIDKDRDKLKKDAENLIKRQVEDIIKKLQEEYKSDIFGFGNILEKEMPNLWNELKTDWNNVFPDVKTEVEVEIDIRGSALRSRPIEVKK